jgi:hypothetical protein
VRIILDLHLYVFMLTGESIPQGHIRAEGKIKNMNTIEDFKNIDRVAILHVAAKQVGRLPQNQFEADGGRSGMLLMMALSILSLRFSPHSPSSRTPT